MLAGKTKSLKKELIKIFRYWDIMLSSGQEDEECDATKLIVALQLVSKI